MSFVDRATFPRISRTSSPNGPSQYGFSLASDMTSPRSVSPERVSMSCRIDASWWSFARSVVDPLALDENLSRTKVDCEGLPSLRDRGCELGESDPAPAVEHAQ